MSFHKREEENAQGGPNGGYLKSSQRRMRRVPFLLILICLFMQSAAWAEAWKLNGTFAAKEEYNDNLFFDDNSREDDFVTTISPGLQLSHRSERLQLGLLGRLDRRIYHSNSGLNATDQFYQGTFRYAPSPRVGLSGLAEYKRDSSPDRDLEITGLVLSDKKRQTQRYVLSGDYTFSEKTSAALSYEYFKEDYDSEEESDLESGSVNLLLLHDLSFLTPAMQGRLNIGYSHYSFTDTKIDSYGASIGVSKAFSETWNIVVDVGARYTQSEFEVREVRFVPPIFYQLVKVDKEDDGWGGIGKAILTYRGEKSTLDVMFSHDLSAASGRNGATNRTNVGFRMSRRFTYEWSGYLSGSYYWNKSDRDEYSVEEINEETFSVNTGVKYDLTKDYSLDASYTYTRTKDKVDDEEPERNLFMIRFNIQHDFLE